MICFPPQKKLIMLYPAKKIAINFGGYTIRARSLLSVVCYLIEIGRGSAYVNDADADGRRRTGDEARAHRRGSHGAAAVLVVHAPTRYPHRRLQPDRLPTRPCTLRRRLPVVADRGVRSTPRRGAPLAALVAARW